jgi:hypothetical protein
MPDLVAKRRFYHDGHLYEAGDTVKVSDSDLKRWESEKDAVLDKGNGKLVWKHGILNHCGHPLPKEAQKDIEKDAKKGLGVFGKDK